MSEHSTAHDSIIGGLILIGVLGALVILMNVILSSCENADAAKQRLVETCVAAGGSWIVDGDDGECWYGVAPSLNQ